MEYATLLTGLGSGVVWALAGWKKEKDTPFDFVQFISTVAIGAVVGAVGEFTKTPYDAVYTTIGSIGLIGSITTGVKLLLNRIRA